VSVLSRSFGSATIRSGGGVASIWPTGSGQAGLVSFTWTAVASASDYEIGVGTGPGQSNVGLYDTASTALTYDLLLPSGLYYVRVSALVGGIWQPPSPDVILNV
jgi:hypothetical protein